MNTSDARARLGRVYQVPRPGQPEPTATDLVTAAERACPYRAEDGPTDGELLDALTLLPAVRSDVERAELRIIDRAREAGITWDRIGVALGYGRGGEGAAQGAQRRATTLRARVAGRPVDDDRGDDPAPVEPGAVVPC